MRLVVGLGNPGAEYAQHRHNVGFMALDRIASEHGLPAWRKKFAGLVAEGLIGGERVLLLKPQTYMNDSGRAVSEAAQFHKVALGDIVVLHDELDLAPGKIRVKAGGGNAGHNGLRSISQHLGNDYVRVRIGIGHPGAKELVHNWVLGNFAKSDRDWLDALLDAIAAAAPRLAAGAFERFQTDVARAAAPDGPDPLPRARSVAADRTGEDAPPPPSPRPARGKHPSGERANKRQNAIAENLEKWLSARKKPD